MNDGTRYKRKYLWFIRTCGYLYIFFYLLFCFSLCHHNPFAPLSIAGLKTRNLSGSAMTSRPGSFWECIQILSITPIANSQLGKFCTLFKHRRRSFVQLCLSRGKLVQPNYCWEFIRLSLRDSLSFKCFLLVIFFHLFPLTNDPKTFFKRTDEQPGNGLETDESDQS